MRPLFYTSPPLDTPVLAGLELPAPRVPDSSLLTRLLGEAERAAEHARVPEPVVAPPPIVASAKPTPRRVEYGYD
ncbi:MAG: hypothetical protein ACRER2_04110 [Methylococcales bacterium]